MSVTCDSLVVFSGYSGFLHQLNWSPRYNWNIVESGVNHHQTNKQQQTSINLTSLMPWKLYANKHQVWLWRICFLYCFFLSSNSITYILWWSNKNWMLPQKLCSSFDRVTYFYEEYWTWNLSCKTFKVNVHLQLNFFSLIEYVVIVNVI